MKAFGDVLVWVVTAIILGLLTFIGVNSYFAQQECEERGGVLLRKATGTVCAKVERL